MGAPVFLLRLRDQFYAPDSELAHLGTKRVDIESEQSSRAMGAVQAPTAQSNNSTDVIIDDGLKRLHRRICHGHRFT